MHKFQLVEVLKTFLPKQQILHSSAVFPLVLLLKSIYYKSIIDFLEIDLLSLKTLVKTTMFI